MLKSDEFPEDNVFIELIAMQGMGKTHISCTAPGKILLLDTELKGYVVAKKFKDIIWKKVETFQDVRSLIQQACLLPDVKTIIIDSGSDLRQLAEAEWIAETKKDKVYPLFLWAKIYEKIDQLVDLMRKANKNFITTSRVKEVWANEKPTGKYVRDAYKKFPYHVDLQVELMYGIDYNNKIILPYLPVAKFVKNGFVKIENTQPFTTLLSFDNIRSVAKKEYTGDLLTNLKFELTSKKTITKLEKRAMQDIDAILASKIK